MPVTVTYCLEESHSVYKMRVLSFILIIFSLIFVACENKDTPAPTSSLTREQSTQEVPSPTVSATSTVARPLSSATPETLAELTVTQVVDVAALTPPYVYLKLEELTIDIELEFVSWEADGQELVYALTRPEARSAEPKDWAWWRYDLETGEKEPLPPPASRVTQDTRQQLNLCPAEQDPLETRPDCPGYSILLESLTSDRIIFSPSRSGGGDTWLGNIDGTNLIKLETLTGTGTHAQWSSDNRWLLISVHFPGKPGQMTHYLVRADGSFETEFSALTDHDLFRLNGLFPQFNPEGTKLAYIGSTEFESFEASDYHLYVLDLESLESRQISDRIGLFQWAADGHGLYVLDGGLYPVDPYEDSSKERNTVLYYLDVTTQPSDERIIATEIPYYPHNAACTWWWGYSPFAQALAHVGYNPLEFGVLLLESPQAGDLSK